MRQQDVTPRKSERVASILTRSLLIGLASLLVAGFLLAQGTITSGGKRWTAFQTYDGKTRPPLSLSEAYVLAQARIGGATNRFYCVRASCLEMTNNGFTGWSFWYSNTNTQQARVDVFFDKEVRIGIQSADLLRTK